MMGRIVLGQGEDLTFGGQLWLHQFYLETSFICIREPLAQIMRDVKYIIYSCIDQHGKLVDVGYTMEV